MTYGSEGLKRVDAFQSGKIAEGWYGSIGGFYRESDGVRDPQYPSDIGGQLTATLKHDLDNGSVMFWYQNHARQESVGRRLSLHRRQRPRFIRIPA